MACWTGDIFVAPLWVLLSVRVGNKWLHVLQYHFLMVNDDDKPKKCQMRQRKSDIEYIKKYSSSILVIERWGRS